MHATVAAVLCSHSDFFVPVSLTLHAGKSIFLGDVFQQFQDRVREGDLVGVLPGLLLPSGQSTVGVTVWDAQSAVSLKGQGWEGGGGVA
jgi:hypothetical protein